MGISENKNKNTYLAMNVNCCKETSCIRFNNFFRGGSHESEKKKVEEEGS